MFKTSLFLAIMIAAMPLCRGAVVFSSGTPGFPEAAYFSDPGSSRWLATQFTLSGSTTINSLFLEGAYAFFNAGTDHFSIAIMADNSGTVGAVVGSYSYSDVPSTREEGVIAFEHQFYEYTLALPTTITLDPGTYWLSVVNASSTGDWALSASPGGIPAPYGGSDTSPTSGYSYSTGPTFVYAFDDTAVVPEPSATALGGLGLCLLARRKRR